MDFLDQANVLFSHAGLFVVKNTGVAGLGKRPVWSVANRTPRQDLRVKVLLAPPVGPGLPGRIAFAPELFLSDFVFGVVPFLEAVFFATAEVPGGDAVNAADCGHARSKR